jgi:hypothetical protein
LDEWFSDRLEQEKLEVFSFEDELEQELRAKFDLIFQTPNRNTKVYWEPIMPHLRFIRFSLKGQNYIGKNRIIDLLGR